MTLLAALGLLAAGAVLGVVGLIAFLYVLERRQYREQTAPWTIK